MKINRPSNMQIIVFLLIIGSIGLIAYQATSTESSVTFFTPAEVYATPEKFTRRSFRVAGLVMKGTKTWESNKQLLTFQISDLKGHDFNVIYKGIPPDLFKEGQGVVLEGRLVSADLNQNKTLLATLLMVKHSEVYDEKRDHSEMRTARLLDSMLK